MTLALALARAGTAPRCSTAARSSSATGASPSAAASRGDASGAPSAPSVAGLRRRHWASSTTPTTSTRRCGCCARRVGRGAGEQPPRAARRGAQRERRAAREPYALYVRVRPWPDARFDIQAGRVPPTFGAFARRIYASDNLLIGYPLAYQYLTSLRPDALPANADELLRMRGRGWLSSFSRRQPDAGPRRAARERVRLGHRRPGARRDRRGRCDGIGHHRHARQPAGSATTTAASRSPGACRVRPRRRAGRRRLRRARLRSSRATAARGRGRRRPRRDSRRRAWGADVEYSRDHYLVRVEAIVSDWTAAGRRARPRIDGRCARCRRRSKAATRSGPASTRRRASITWGSATITGHQRT